MLCCNGLQNRIFERTLPLEYFSALLSLYMNAPSAYSYICLKLDGKLSLLRPDINKNSIDFRLKMRLGMNKFIIIADFILITVMSFRCH